MTHTPANEVEFHLLGTLEVTANGGSLDLGPPKQRALLAVLLLHANEVVPTERLVDLIWGDEAPRTAVHSIQIYVSDLRKALGSNRAGIVTRPPGYLLQVEPAAVDMFRFEQMVEKGLELIQLGRKEEGAGWLRAALELWRGPALTEFVYEDFAQSHIRLLDERRSAAIEELAGTELGLGRGKHLIPLLQELIGRDPLREEPRRLLMLVLNASGRQAEALRSFSEYQGLLGDELGLAPSPELRRLEEQILLQDPALPGFRPPDEIVVPFSTRNPYKGLRPFGEADAGDFFGRESLELALARRLAEGQRLLVVVGPSGCGKSSLVKAGLIPAVRAAEPGWIVAQMMPGTRPFDELAAALQRAAPGPAMRQLDDIASDDAFLQRAALRLLRDEGDRLLLVIDQFEELFVLTGEEDRQEFLDGLVMVLTDPRRRVSVVLTLRADFYDRPLHHPGFATHFVNSMVTMLPLGPSELEAAVIGPARGVGVGVEPALLAVLVAEMADQPGALPLLQYALTETFELREGQTLSLDTYRRVGGLEGALSGRSEHAFQSLNPEEQEAARQVFLRLVRPGQGADHTRKRTAVSELLELDLDPVAISRVIEEFTNNRLLTLDRDLATGRASVEVAHEALLREWPRLAAAIEEHRQDLVKHEALEQAVVEWDEAGHDPDYLFSGSRLGQYERWRHETGLRLTAAQREFLSASIARRDADQAAADARRERERVLERRARSRTWGLAAAIALVVAAGTYIARGAFIAPPDVTLFWDGVPNRTNDAIEAGFDRAVSDLGLTAAKVNPVADFHRDLELTAQEEPGLLVVSGLPGYMFGACEIAARLPGTRMVYLDGDVFCDSLASFRFGQHEGSFLVGAAAALKTRTGTVGFIGGVDVPLIKEFEAGFRAGVRHIDPTIRVRAEYLTEPPDFTGFLSFIDGLRSADAMYREGVDVIYNAAGESGWGIVEAAQRATEELGEQVWVIGVDVDQYEEVETLEGYDTTGWAPHILTSMVKRLDVAAYTAVVENVGEDFSPGPRPFGLAEGGVGYTTSGGFLDDVVPQLKQIEAAVVDGSIVVPKVAIDSDGLFTAHFSPRLRLEVPAAWTIGVDEPGVFLIEQPGSHGLLVARDIMAVTADGWTPVEGVGETAEDVARWVASHPDLTASQPQRVTVGGLQGWSTEISVAGGEREVVLFEGLFLGGEFPFSIGPTELVRLYLLELPERGTVLAALWVSSGSPTVLEEASAVIAGLVFESGA